ncbi:tRNA (adenine-N1)-methyltransferase [Deferribacter autotrophicus]|uniref:tRNA (adenine(58)-N(1))-methyltransferase TrmI n=1 Tax=Deferribacter autotrophicus TaxID=500465 RepID=A0A5A8F297_9BACT|nr:tRNA (adenine-N1)-methyltransferase [Deferribacter autotrophicus]KAA0257871.1 tRNA (adenine-N1)-methyltransferase [Deferribacter autotrophicus]
MKNNRFEFGDFVIIIDEKERTKMFKLKEGGRYSCQYGYVDHQEIVGLEDGSVVETNKKGKLRVFSPTYIDYVMNLKRKAQIVYPKDSAIILMWADIYPGLKVLEAGIGQGALSIAILRALAGKGNLTTYEVREDFIEMAKKTIEDFLPEVNNHDVIHGNIYDGFEGVYDRIILDLPEPWHVVKHCKEGLISGGIIVSYVPTILQAKSFVDELKSSGFFDQIETFEIIKRPWKIEGMSVRPEMWFYSHSAFLIKARKLSL